MPRKYWILFTLFFIAVVCFCFTCLSSCEVIKGKKSVKSDSTAVSKNTVNALDTSKSGSVTKSEVKSKEENEWWRIIQSFQKDTVNNVTNVYPSTVVYEGGKGTREQTENKVDSTWFKNYISFMQSKYDSLSSKLEQVEKNKQSETKGVGLIMVIIIVIAAIILYAILSGYLKRFKIIRT